jgi:hypothetical protein
VKENSMRAALTSWTSRILKVSPRLTLAGRASGIVLCICIMSFALLLTTVEPLAGAPTPVAVSQSRDATSLGYQRKTFRDNGDYFWTFYSDGTDTYYKRSDDTTGASWTGATQLFSSGEVQPSVWFDSDTLWVAFSSGGSILVREGIVSGTIISWSPVYTALAGDGTTSYTRASVCRDSDGFIWITARVGIPSGFQVCAVRSAIPNDVSSWQSPETISSTFPTNSVYAVVVPLNDGDVYVVWNRQGWIEGKKFVSGTGWEGGTTSIARGVQNDPNMLFSAVSDIDGGVHLLYVSRFTPVCYRSYDGASWSSEQVLSGPNVSSPTISINPSNQRLYALWIEDGRVECMSAVLPSSSSDWRDEWTNKGRARKANLVSCYGSDSRVSWLLTKGRNAPYNVVIDGIAVARISVLVSVSSFAFGTQPVNTWLPARSTQIANDGTWIEDIYARLSEFTSGPFMWGISGASNGPDVCRVQWSSVSDAGPWNDIASYETEFLVTSNLGVGASVTLYLRIQTPTSTSSFNEHSANLTVRAEDS